MTDEREKKQDSALNVRPGLASTPQPTLRVKKRKQPTADEFVEGVLSGNRMMIGRTLSLMESVNPDHREKANEVLNRLMEKRVESIRLGISGIPGVGKSTFIEAFGCHVIEQGHRVAVLAIDPSSEVTGGSILGDKTRMERLSLQENALVRPTANSGWAGGVARASRESIIVCEAAGYDVIIIETVGVGQSETQAASMVDFFLLLMIAGAGDELQGIKRGILELADGIAINKADGDNLEKATLARAQFQSALRLLRSSTDAWQPRVQTCSSITGAGIPELWNLVKGHHDWATDTGILEDRRRKQALYWMSQTLDHLLKQKFYNHPAVKSRIDSVREEVVEGKLSPFLAAEQILRSAFPEHEL